MSQSWPCVCSPLLRSLHAPLRRRRLFSAAPSPVLWSRAYSATVPAPPSPPFRVLFLGSDSFSCEALTALHEAREGLIDEIVVVTPADTRTGRGLKNVHTPPLRLLASRLSLPSISLPPTGITDWDPPPPFAHPPSPSNLLITASFGYLIPNRVLSLFHPLNTLNVHPSLLPKYRGAAPIQWTIINGDKGTGVTVQELSRNKFDQGRVLGKIGVQIDDEPDFTRLEPILAKAGANLLIATLRNLAAAQNQATPQDPALASSAPKLTKDDARISWSTQTSQQILRLQRGIAHQFPLWTTLPARSPLPVHLTLSRLPCAESESASESPRPLECAPGELHYDSRLKLLLVRTAGEEAEEKLLVVQRVKVAGSGKGWVEAREWWNGAGKGEKGLKLVAV